MSRVHDALRKAEANFTAVQRRAEAEASVSTPPPESLKSEPMPAPVLTELLERVPMVPLQLSPDASLVDLARPNEAPMEEFRTLRTRLNHLQGLQPIHSVVVTSPSPAEGKSFTAANLALVQSHLDGNMTLLADFDFRRPVLHHLFQIERTPGVTDYLQGKARLEEVLRRVQGTNLFLLPAGEAVINPLELLNLAEAGQLLETLPTMFNWVILDTPPLLFAADANLLSSMCHGTIMVVRMGATTIDSVTRAMQSLCQNNLLGIVVNGAQKSELYHKYTYYHSYYYSKPEEASEPSSPQAVATTASSSATDDEDDD